MQAALGLQAGDVIVAINGQPVGQEHDADMRSVFVNAAKKRPCSFHVKRRASASASA